MPPVLSLDSIIISALNGASYGLLLFMLSAGLAVVMNMSGVLNFAHASFYMLGAYIAYSVSRSAGFWVALVVSPILVAVLASMFEMICLRKIAADARSVKFSPAGFAQGHVAELLATFGLSYVAVEAVQLLWGKSTIPFELPALLQGPLFAIGEVQFAKSRAFIMALAVVMFLAVWLVSRTRVGLITRASLQHPAMVESLGHDVRRLCTMVFASGAFLAALAGVIGGAAFVTEPGMAAALGPIIFVVVVAGGVGSIGGAFLASIAIGMLQTFAVAFGISAAPLLPYLFMIAVLVFRPQGFAGMRR